MIKLKERWLNETLIEKTVDRDEKRERDER